MRLAGSADRRPLRAVLVHRSRWRRGRLRTWLNGNDVQTVEFSRAADALEALTGEDLVDVLIMQDGLRAPDGRELADVITHEPRFHHLGVVAVDARRDVARAAFGVRTGVHSYLSQPIRPVELVSAVRSAARMKALQLALESRAGDLEALADSDQLTGLYNRRFLMRQLRAMTAASVRHGNDLSVIIMDVDYFKKVNDEHGHLAGDRVLRGVAQRIADRVREAEYVGRYGGEEFLVLAHADRAGAMQLAESLRHGVGEHPVAFEQERIPVTISAGVAVWRGETPEDLLALADEALYEAKRTGRDRVCVAPERPRAMARFTGAPTGSAAGRRSA